MKLLSSFLTCGLLLLMVSPLKAQSPATKLLPFQGRLADATGKPIPDGVRLIQFRIFDTPTAGNSVWPPGELHRATVNAGVINVVLGSKTLFTDLDFNRTLYLDIVVDANGDSQITVDDPPLLPRQAILPVIFATESAVSRDSQKLAGYDWSAIFGTNNPSGKLDGARIVNLTSNSIAPLTINSSLIAAGAITSDKLAADTVPKFAQVVATNSFRAGQGWSAPREMTITMRLNSSNVLVQVSGSGRSLGGGSGNGNGLVRLNRDNSAEIVNLGVFVLDATGSYRGGFCFQHIFTGLSSGNHIFGIEFNGIGASVTIDPVNYPELESLRMQVLELR